MATVKNYYTFGGELIGEQILGGERLDYLSDPLGNVTATVNQSCQIVNSYEEKPYGEPLSKTGSGSDPACRWVGVHGYRSTGLKYAEVYVRRRHYSTELGRWTSRDPLRFVQLRALAAYVYAKQNPVKQIDPSGLVPTFGSGCNCLSSTRENGNNCIAKLCDPRNWRIIEECVRRVRELYGINIAPACISQWCASGQDIQCSSGETIWSPCQNIVPRQCDAPCKPRIIMMPGACAEDTCSPGMPNPGGLITICCQWYDGTYPPECVSAPYPYPCRPPSTEFIHELGHLCSGECISSIGSGTEGAMQYFAICVAARLGCAF
jgi:RHS repeat-associated protein